MNTTAFFKIIRPSVFLSIFLLFVSCGGGGGGSSSSNSQAMVDVSGRVLDSNGTSIPGSTVSIASNPVVVTTDNSGKFSAKVEPGNHTITISMGNVTFYQNTFTANEGTQVSLGDLSPTTPYYYGSAGYSISGTVTVSSVVLQGVIITLSGTSSGTATTYSNGNYTFTGLANGSYTITPSLTGYTFNSVSETVKINGTNIASINFTATASSGSTYNISGTVTISGGVGPGYFPVVLMTLSGTSSGTATADSNGNYTFTGLANGSYTVTPSLAGDTFNPTSMAVKINGADATSINFIATALPIYSISGTVKIIGGGVLPGVLMTLDGSSTGTAKATTDSNGNYNFTGLANGFYSVTASSVTGYTFKTTSCGMLLNGANSASNDFTAGVTNTYAVGNGPHGIAIDGSGNVWVVNSGSMNVTKLSSTGAVLGTYGVGSVYGLIAIDSSDNVWVTDRDNNVIKLSSAGAVLCTYTVFTGSNGPPGAIAIDGSDNVWVIGCNYNVTKLSSTGAVLGTYTYSIGYDQSFGIAIDSSDNVWVTNYLSASVTKLSSTGAVFGTYTLPSSGYHPYGIAIDSLGNVWLACSYVNKLSPTGGVLGSYNVGNNSQAIAIDGSDNVWVINNYNTGRVTELSSAGAVLGTYSVGATQKAIAIDGSGNVWVTNSLSNSVTELVGVASPVKTPLVLQSK